MPCCPSPNLVVRRYVGEEATYRYCTSCHDLPDQDVVVKDLVARAVRAEEVFGADELEHAESARREYR